MIKSRKQNPECVVYKKISLSQFICLLFLKVKLCRCVRGILYFNYYARLSHRIIVQNRKKPLFTFNVGYSTALRSAMVKTFNANKPKVAPNFIDFLDLYTQLSEVSVTWFAQIVTELCFCNLSRCGALLHLYSYFMINMLFFAIDLTELFD